MPARRNATRFVGLLALVALAGSVGPARAKKPVCGDGSTQRTEECDDGNTTSFDGCSATCALEKTSSLCAGVSTTTGAALSLYRVTTGLSRPVYVTAPPLDPIRLFVVEQAGRIRVVKNGALLGAPFLDIESKVLSRGTEQGLLGLAFHPKYKSNGRFFVSYTAPGGGPAGHSVLAEYRVGTLDLNVADPASEKILLTVDQPYANHNGGFITFSPNGALFLGLGDGGSACDPAGNAQNDASMLGKLIRLNVEGSPPSIETWAKGLRNPWRFSFDRLLRDLYIADVGQYAYEEIDFLPFPGRKGQNYGWNAYEGTHCPVSGCPKVPCADPGFDMPVLEYDHSEGCSITGGFVYRGCRMPDLRGTYFYSDYCTPFIKTFTGINMGKAQFRRDRTSQLPRGALKKVSSFGEDARGELYVTDHLDGEVWKIVPKADADP